MSIQQFSSRQIAHLFVLMLENRSFDHMLGFAGLQGTDPVTGQATQTLSLAGTESNSYLGQDYAVLKGADFVMPFDPGHEFGDVLQQLCGETAIYQPGSDYPTITNSGFVSNFATTRSPGAGGADSNFGEILHSYDALREIPVLTTLASEFAVCDHWFSSLPGPTWPNRFFIHASTAAGLDHSPTTAEILDWQTVDGFEFPHGSIYDLLDNRRIPWRIYRGVRHPLIGSIPTVSALKGIEIWNTHPYERFRQDLQGKYPFLYTFIEPNYGDITNNSYSGGQSEHPMDDVRGGESLIKSTYEAIRQSPLWEKSMLVIVYDEHGGFFDHVAPGVAPYPGDTIDKFNQSGFTFRQYGVRVPALVVSPFIPKNTVDHRVYDHSSIPATIESLTGLPALTARDAAAANLVSLCIGDLRRDAPWTLPSPASPSLTQRLARWFQKRKVAKPQESLNKGNLPGFLHLALKGKQHAPISKASTPADEIERFSGLKTRRDAKNYLERILPQLTSIPSRDREP